MVNIHIVTGQLWFDAKAGQSQVVKMTGLLGY
jgi:hypothetical protein